MFGRRRKPNDFDDEIRAHLELEADRFRKQGLSEREALAAAQRTFGNVSLSRERFYESHRWLAWDLFWQDLKFGLRMLRKNPGTSAAAVFTLALGIGANSAIFSMLDAVMLRKLPVSQPQNLVLFGKGRAVGSNDDVPDRSTQLFSYRFYQDFQARTQSFSDVTAINSIGFDTHGRVAEDPELEKILVQLVSGTYFETLGVRPVIGHAFTRSDDATPGGAPIAVASYSFWQRRFGGNPDVIGRKITIRSTIYTIIGVGPSQFFGASVGQSPDLWVPLAMEKEISPGWNGLDNKLFQSLYIIARRKPAADSTAATSETNFLFRQILRDYVGPQPSKRDLDRIQHARIELTPAATGLSQLRIQFSTPLRILMAVVALVLLIACANVANLLLARAAARQREIAVRLSIGANRWRLIRQMFVESALLASAGVLFGVLFAWGATRVLLAMVATGPDAVPLNISPDIQVLTFTLGITILTVLLFGTVPALSGTRVQLVSALKDGRGVTAPPLRNRVARGLIVLQVALSLTLLIGSALFLRTLVNLMNVDTGFDKHNVLVTTVDWTGAGYETDARLQTAMNRVEEHVSRIPGIQAASMSFFVFNGGGWTGSVSVPGRPQSDNDPDVAHNIVGAQYLSAMKMPLLLGRSLDVRDDAGSPHVAVINETMARLYFPSSSPIGRTFNVGDKPEWQNIQVVGLVKDGKYMDLNETPMPAAFYPHSQHPSYIYNLVIRYSGDPKLLIPEIRKKVHEVDPNLPVGDFSTLSEMVDANVKNRRVVAQLSTFFGLLAAFLACIGIYGVMSYGIARRTSEIGIRIALGAGRHGVLWMVLREALRLVLVGVSIGLAITLASTRLAENLLFGLKSYDPLAIALGTAAMVSIGLIASYLPARRATRINPLVALRYE